MTSSLHTHDKHLPELKEWEVGKKYKMQVQGIMTSHSHMDGKHYASFDINHIDPELDEQEAKGGDNDEKRGTSNNDNRKRAKAEGKKEEKEEKESGEEEKVKRLSEKFERRKG